MYLPQTKEQLTNNRLMLGCGSCRCAVAQILTWICQLYKKYKVRLWETVYLPQTQEQSTNNRLMLGCGSCRCAVAQIMTWICQLYKKYIPVVLLLFSFLLLVSSFLHHVMLPVAFCLLSPLPFAFQRKMYFNHHIRFITMHSSPHDDHKF